VPIRGVLILAFFVGSLPVCFFRPFYGILLWTVVAFLNPQSSIVYWSAAAAFPWALAVAIPTLCGFALFSSGWPQRLASREVFLMVVLWVWFTITSLVSTRTPLFMPHAADTWARWEFVSKVLLMTLVTIAIVDTFARLRILVMVMAGCFGILVLKWLPYIVASVGGVHIYGPKLSMIADNNDFGLALNMTLPLYLFLALTESNRWLKWLCAFMFVGTVPAIFCTYSRGALVGLTAVVGLMLLRLKQRVVLVPLVILIAVAALLIAPKEWKDRMNPKQGLDSSARERLNAWTFCWNLASDYPVTGGGFSTFTPELFQRYATVADDVRGPHSVYFGVLAEHGFVGLALYLTLIFSCLAKARRLLKQARFDGDQTLLNYANMFLFSLIGFLVSGFFLGRAYFDYFFSIVACLVVLGRLAHSAVPDVEMLGEPAEEGHLLPDSRVSLQRG
jgi:probable O-glycosylation ligase (exosortase A-associated)